MTFIRASKRLPPTENHYHGKVDGIKRIINFYVKERVTYCYVSNSYSIHQDYFDTVWWLEEEEEQEEQGLTIADYEEVLKDRDRLVREIDVILNGEEGAAKQASLCDLVGQIQELKEQNQEIKQLREAYKRAATEIQRLNTIIKLGNSRL